MIYHFSPLAAAVVAVLPIGAHARECLTNETIPEGYSHWTPSLDLTDPSQLTQFSDCDTLIGIIEVSRNFTGTIELPAVTNFSGYINLYEGPTYGLEAVVLPNVRYMESIQLHGAWGVKRLYAPKVETLDDLIVSVGVEEGAVFDLSALREVKYVSMAGYWSSFSLPSLETISSGMWVYTDPSRSETDVLVPMNINLPVLKQTDGLFLHGQIKSLSTPQLEILGHRQAYPSGMELHSNYSSMDGVFLPALREMYGDFWVSGGVSAVDLGLMQNTSAPIKIDVDSPIEIYSGLENAAGIFVRGPLAVINFTNLTTASDMNITTTSNIPISCPRALIDIYRYFSDPAEPAFCNAESLFAAGENPYLNPDYTPVGGYPTPSATITSDSASTSTWGYGYGSTPTPWWSPTPTPVYSPTPTPGGGGGKLSSGAEAAIATVAVVVGLVGIGGWIVARRRSKRAKTQSEGTVSGSGTGRTGGTELGVVAPAVVRPVITTNRRGDDGEEGEGLPRHSADVAPPPYSREEPGKV